MYLTGERKLSWIRMIFKVRGSVLPRIWMRIVFVTLVAAVITAFERSLHDMHISLTTTPFVLIGLPLGIFLGFRNSASYDRYWEGRRLWGSVVNTSRTVARLALTLIGPGPGRSVDEHEAGEQAELRRELIMLVIAYVQALRMHLRSEKPFDELARLLPLGEVEPLRKQRNVPTALLLRAGARVADAYRRGWVEPVHLPLFEAALATFTDCQGGCERIRSTPVPFSYIVLIHRITGGYCFLLPLGLLETLHYFTPLAVLFVSYALFSLDAIGDEIEDPFGTEVNDLPLLAISRTIEINLRQALGEHDLPPPIEAQDGVLL